jgi:hypothetical protein
MVFKLSNIILQGNGITQWPDGKRYEGEYLDDKKHGYGVFSWENGKQYEGIFLINL